MSTIILPEVRFFTEEDAYHFTTENRPLGDLAARDNAIAASIERDRSVQINEDEDVILTNSSPYYQYFRNALTNNRSITLPSTGLYIGLSFHIVRYAISPFTLTILDNLSGKNITFSANQRRFVKYVLVSETEWLPVSNGTLP